MRKGQANRTGGRKNRKGLLFKLLLGLLGAGVIWSCLQLSTCGSPRGVRERTGAVQHGELTEISGIVVSRRNRDVIWAHNDSGDSARIFAMKTDGTHRGIFTLSGARAIDYEDIAIGPGPNSDLDYIYVADTGNNALDRKVVTVYRLPEPSLDEDAPPVTRKLTGVVALRMRFPRSPRECETLLVDPLTADLYLVSRERGTERTRLANVFRYPAPHEPGVTRTLKLVTTFPAPVEIKGGDLSPDGRIVLLRAHSPRRRTSALAWIWEREKSLARVLATPGSAVPVAFERKGEAIAFSADGLSYYTIGEGLHPPIYRYALPPLESNP